jgi:hypothetical protein
MKKDITGKTFGILTALNNTDNKSSNSDYIWNCICKCGNYRLVPIGQLTSGSAKYCNKNCSEKPKKITLRSIPGYKSWLKIRERCYNVNSPDYTDYGAKGIKMSDTFYSSFECFIKHIGEKPSNKHSVDRLDNTKGYIEGNVRWADSKQQSRNKGKQSNNSSGKTGVQFYWSGVPGHDTYVVSSWYEVDKLSDKLKYNSKKFPIKKYGLLEAFNLACLHRKEKIAHLNQNGYGYSDTHGQ